jgi:hypothetical protein
VSISAGLIPSLAKIAQLQRETFDSLAFADSIRNIVANDPDVFLDQLFDIMHLKSPKWLPSADVSQTPALIYVGGMGWAVLRGQNAAGLFYGSFNVGVTARISGLKTPGRRQARAVLHSLS